MGRSLRIALFLIALVALLGFGEWHTRADVKDTDWKASGASDTPQVLMVEKKDAWCYILINDTRVGPIHTLSCVLRPKWGR